MPLVLAAVLGLAGLLFVLFPLFARVAHSARPSSAASEAADGEQLARTALREVEFDHSLGNLEDADYLALRARYEQRALSALKLRYERERALDERIERELAALRARADVDAGDRADNASSRRSTVPTRPRRATSQGPRTRRGKGL